MKVNEQKPRMFAAPVVHRRTREQILGRYLGVPLLRPRLYKSTFCLFDGSDFVKIISLESKTL